MPLVIAEIADLASHDDLLEEVVFAEKIPHIGIELVTLSAFSWSSIPAPPASKKDTGHPKAGILLSSIQFRAGTTGSLPLS